MGEIQVGATTSADIDQKIVDFIESQESESFRIPAEIINLYAQDNVIDDPNQMLINPVQITPTDLLQSRNPDIESGEINATAQNINTSDLTTYFLFYNLGTYQTEERPVDNNLEGIFSGEVADLLSELNNRRNSQAQINKQIHSAENNVGAETSGNSYSRSDVNAISVANALYRKAYLQGIVSDPNVPEFVAHTNALSGPPTSTGRGMDHAYAATINPDEKGITEYDPDLTSNINVESIETLFVQIGQNVIDEREFESTPEKYLSTIISLDQQMLRAEFEKNSDQITSQAEAYEKRKELMSSEDFLFTAEEREIAFAFDQRIRLSDFIGETNESGIVLDDRFKELALDSAEALEQDLFGNFKNKEEVVRIIGLTEAEFATELAEFTSRPKFNTAEIQETHTRYTGYEMDQARWETAERLIFGDGEDIEGQPEVLYATLKANLIAGRYDEKPEFKTLAENFVLGAERLTPDHYNVADHGQTYEDYLAAQGTPDTFGYDFPAGGTDPDPPATAPAQNR